MALYGVKVTQESRDLWLICQSFMRFSFILRIVAFLSEHIKIPLFTPFVNHLLYKAKKLAFLDLIG